MKVDEALGSKKTIELVFARGISAHEALQSRWLVVAEVIDVKAGVRLPSGHHLVDERLEGRLLGCSVRGPEGLVLRRLFIEEHVSEEVLEPVLSHEASALEVEEDIAWAWLRKTTEALPWRNRQQLVDRRAIRSALHLHARLLA